MSLFRRKFTKEFNLGAVLWQSSGMKLGHRTVHERLTSMCFIDYHRQMALVAEQTVTGEKRILGFGTLVRSRDFRTAELAVAVSDSAFRPVATARFAFTGLG